MPRAGDQFPQQRGANDLHSPLRGLLDYTQPLNDTAVQAGQHITAQIGAAAAQGGTAASNTTITNILQQLGVGTVIGDTATAQLGAYLAQLLTPNSALNASNLWGLLPPGTLGPVPATNLTTAPVNPLWNPNFEGAVSLGQADGWSWDNVTYYPAPGPAPFYPVGSAKVTANGRTHALKSNPIPVTAGETVTFTVPVLATGLVATGDPIQLSVITYLNDTQVGTQTLEVLPAPTGATTGWVAPPTGSHGDTLVGSYVAPTDHSVNKILVRFVLDQSATAGVVRYGAVGVTISGDVISTINGDIAALNNDAAAAQTANANWWASITDAVVNHGTNWPVMFAQMSAATTTYAEITSGLTSSALATLGQLASTVLGYNPSTGLQNPATVANKLGQATLADDMQAILDFIANGLGHPGTGHTLADVESYFGIVPANTSSISTNQTWLNQISQIVNGQFVTPINTAVTQFKTWWAAITGTGAAGTITTAAIAGTLPPAQVGSALGGASIAADVSGNASNINAHLNNVVAQLLGIQVATQQTPAQAAQALGNIANTVVSLSAQLQAAQTTQSGVDQSGTSFGVGFQRYPDDTDFSGAPFKTTYTGAGSGHLRISSGKATWVGVSDGDRSALGLYITGFVLTPPATGAWTATFNGVTTSSIPNGSTAATVQAALQALSNMPANNVLVAGADGGPYTVALGIFGTLTASGTGTVAPIYGVTSTDFQQLQATISGLPNGGNARNYAILRANAAGTTYVYGVVFLNTSFQLCWELGCYVAGVLHVFASGVNAPLNFNFTFRAGVGTNPYHFQGVSGNTTVFDYVDAAHVSQLGSTLRGWGFRSDTANGGQATPAPAQYCGVADNAPVSTVGSGFRMCRTITANTTGTLLNLNLLNQFPANFFDTVTANTADLTFSTSGTGTPFGAGQPYVTIGIEGWYTVDMRVAIYQFTASVAMLTICPGVFRSTNGGTTFSAYEVGGSGGAAFNVVGAQSSTSCFGGAMRVYCKVGDILVPGYWMDYPAATASSISALSFTGDVNGILSHWSVVLENHTLA